MSRITHTSEELRSLRTGPGGLRGSNLGSEGGDAGVRRARAAAEAGSEDIGGIAGASSTREIDLWCARGTEQEPKDV